MDRACQQLLPRYRDNFPRVAHKERWGFLKPLIIELYTGNYGTGRRKTATMDQVVDFMKKYYAFHATYAMPFLKKFFTVQNLTNTSMMPGPPNILITCELGASRNESRGMKKMQQRVHLGDESDLEQALPVLLYNEAIKQSLLNLTN